MENKIKIGDTVITRKFETSDERPFLPAMEQFVNTESVIQAVGRYGNYRVHDYWWPKESVDPVTKQWEPKPGEMVEASDYLDNDPMFNDGYKPDWKSGTFLIMDGEKFIVKRGSNYYAYNHCRPLQKSLREQISEILYESPKADTKALDRIMEVIGRSKE